VIAEDGHGRGPKSFDESQDGVRLWAAIDEVADKPYAIARSVEIDPVEQAFEVGMAALNVADGEYGHEFSRLDSRFS
jgi:hypothetical protein